MTRDHFRSQKTHKFAGKVQGLVILLILILATAWVSGGQYLVIRQLWMDEVHSWLIVTDQSQSHAMRALADGADFNPPMWFLITRWLTTMTGPATELQLRLLSLTWMLLSLSGLYVLLSRVFSPNVCVTAVLLTASHPLLIHQSTEIRYYGFWFASVVWLCNTLQWSPAVRSFRLLQMIVVSGLALFTTTCHYFGILSILLVILPLVYRPSHDRDAFRLAVIAVTTSIISLAGCGYFLVGQRAALSRPTWISPTTLGDSILFVQTLLPAWQILLCCAALVVSLATAKRFSSGVSRLKISSDAAELLPCLCLIGMPLMIVLVAWLLQPALVTRYAMVGIAGSAPLFATAVKQCSPSCQKVLRVAAVLGLGYTVGHCVDQWKADDAERLALIRKLDACPVDSLIVFEDRIQFMSVLHLVPEYSTRCRLSDFTDSEMRDDSTLRIVQRDAGRRIQKWYPQYGMLPIRVLARQPLFFIVPYADGTVRDLEYPAEYSISEQSAGVFCFRRIERLSDLSQCSGLKPPFCSVEASSVKGDAEKQQKTF
jgi:hypothetical protein